MSLQGALGALLLNWGYDDSTLLPYGSVKPCWGNPTRLTMRTEMPGIPCLGLFAGRRAVAAGSGCPWSGAGTAERRVPGRVAATAAGGRSGALLDAALRSFAGPGWPHGLLVRPGSQR